MEISMLRRLDRPWKRLGFVALFPVYAIAIWASINLTLQLQDYLSEKDHFLFVCHKNFASSELNVNSVRRSDNDDFGIAVRRSRERHSPDVMQIEQTERFIRCLENDTNFGDIVADTKWWAVAFFVSSLVAILGSVVLFAAASLVAAWQKTGGALAGWIKGPTDRLQ